MSIHIKIPVLSLLLILTLAACQTVPLVETRQTSFSAPSSGESGQVRIGAFHIPKEEPGTTLLLILGAVGGADINFSVGASIFDITEETHYLGTLTVGKLEYPQSWIEYVAPVGKRTFMLIGAPDKNSIVMGAGSFTQHVDFIDIDIKPGGINHVVLSRYGFARQLYLGEVQISSANLRYCESLSGKPREREKSVVGYMAEKGIDPYARDFKNFCRLVSDPKYIINPTAESLRQFVELGPHIENLREVHHEKWKVEAEKRTPYKLMRSYPPVSSQNY